MEWTFVVLAGFAPVLVLYVLYVLMLRRLRRGRAALVTRVRADLVRVTSSFEDLCRHISVPAWTEEQLSFDRRRGSVQGQLHDIADFLDRLRHGGASGTFGFLWEEFVLRGNARTLDHLSGRGLQLFRREAAAEISAWAVRARTNAEKKYEQVFSVAATEQCTDPGFTVLLTRAVWDHGQLAALGASIVEVTPGDPLPSKVVRAVEAALAAARAHLESVEAHVQRSTRSEASSEAERPGPRSKKLYLQ